MIAIDTSLLMAIDRSGPDADIWVDVIETSNEMIIVSDMRPKANLFGGRGDVGTDAGLFQMRFGEGGL